MSTGSQLIKHVITLLAKSFLLPLGLTTGVTATEEEKKIQKKIQKKILGSGTTALIISNEEMEDIMKIVESLEESGLLIKRVSETVKK